LVEDIVYSIYIVNYLPLSQS